MSRISPALIEARHEAERLRHIIRETLWMAQRYADGRSTYAVGMYNDAVKLAILSGIEVRPDPVTGTVFALDGMFGYPRYASAYPHLHRPVPALPSPRVALAPAHADRETHPEAVWDGGEP